MSTIIYNRTTHRVCNILINRPSKCNALNLESIKLLQEALRRFENDSDMNVAVIAGVGGNFCSGYDLNEIINPDTAMPNIDHLKKMLWPLGPRLSENKPVIAAIEGHAAGFGYELALKCDLRYADKDARMGFMNRRFGIPIMNGGTVILPRMIGHSRAMELISTGKAQLAPEALSYGLLTKISDVGCAIGVANNYARSLSKFDQEALTHDMRATSRTSFGNSISEEDLQEFFTEQNRSLEYIKSSGPLEVAAKFLSGEMCRRGSYDMGNLEPPDVEVTL